MRYPDSGGLSEQGRANREAVRLQAAEWFAQDMPVAEIARRVRVSANAVYVGRRAGRAQGPAALASKGPGGSACRLDERELVAARDWLHVIRLPAYAPEVNPVEQVWSQVKRGLGSLLVWGIDELVTVVKNRLQRIQYRSELIDAFLAHTGLDLEPP